MKAGSIFSIVDYSFAELQSAVFDYFICFFKGAMSLFSVEATDASFFLIYLDSF